MSITSYFVPNRQQIQSISNANPAVVTTTQDHGYLTGLVVRLTFPVTFGMPEVNGQIFEITVLTTRTFSIPVNSTAFQAFTVASTTQVAQVIPVAEIASTLTSATRNNDNIVPEL